MEARGSTKGRTRVAEVWIGAKFSKSQGKKARPDLGGQGCRATDHLHLGSKKRGIGAYGEGIAENLEIRADGKLLSAKRGGEVGRCAQDDKG
jgi:hypothetical protein